MKTVPDEDDMWGVYSHYVVVAPGVGLTQLTH
jgi:hypothetical protein